MPVFIFVFSVHGGYYTALSYDVIHGVLVLFTFARVSSELFDTLFRPKFSVTSRYAYYLGLGPNIWSQTKV